MSYQKCTLRYEACGFISKKGAYLSGGRALGYAIGRGWPVAGQAEPVIWFLQQFKKRFPPICSLGIGYGDGDGRYPPSLPSGDIDLSVVIINNGP